MSCGKSEEFGGKDIQEDQDAPEDILDDTRKILGRIFGLAGGDGNGLCSTICNLMSDIVFSAYLL